MLRNFLKLQMYICLFAMVLSIVSCSSQSKEKEDAICFIDTVVVRDSIVSQSQRIGIKMHKRGGVYEIPCVVNGLQMNFIFDTGASNVCISLTEALFMYKNGYITDEDLGEKSYSQVADGSIVVNMQLNLRSIEIAGIELKNVDAIVVASMEAPLLLGQSAIQRIGKIEMDGDSLFIMGIPSNAHPLAEKNNSTAINLSHSPSITWWDRVKVFYGSEAKIDELLDAAKNANKHDMPEMAQKYCAQIKALKPSCWKSYGYEGHMLYANVIDNNDYTQLNYIIDTYINALNYNSKKETHHFLDGDSMSYDGCRNRLALIYALAANVGVLSYDDQIKGKDYIQKLITEQPMNVNANDAMAIYYEAEGKYDLAVKWAEKVLKIEETSGYFRLAWIEKREGDINKAIEYYEKALEFATRDDGTRASIMYNLACLLWERDTKGFKPRHSGNNPKWPNDYVLVHTDREKADALQRKAAKLGHKGAQKWLKKNNINWVNCE